MVCLPLMATDSEINPVISARSTYPEFQIMLSIDYVFQRLATSPFRQRFHLGANEYQYCQVKGSDIVRQHAADFIAKRLAPAEPEQDGKQTPMRGHPVFIAQHATATCCRGCLQKWHQIPAHVPITATQQAYIVNVILHWLHQEMQHPAPPAKRRKSRKKEPDKAGDSQQLNLL